MRQQPQTQPNMKRTMPRSQAMPVALEETWVPTCLPHRGHWMSLGSEVKTGATWAGGGDPSGDAEGAEAKLAGFLLSFINLVMVELCGSEREKTTVKSEGEKFTSANFWLLT